MSTIVNTSRIDSVLVFEPASRIRANLEVALKQCDYRVVLREGSDTAKNLFNTIEREAPDVVLISSSLSCEEFDSFKICQLIVKRGLVPAVVMTDSQPTKERVLKSLRAGAMGFVVTPSDNSRALSKKLEHIYRQTPEAESRAQFPTIHFGARELTARQKVDIITRDVSTIRVMPFAVTKVLQIAGQDKSSAKELARAAESDPSLAAMILKHANSAFYGGGDPVTSLQGAVVRMGFKECRDQVVGMSVSNLFSKEEKSFGFNRVWYWLHSISCALFAQRIARRASFEDSDQAFTVGLIHDIGKIILDDFLNKEYRAVVRSTNTSGVAIADAEETILERNHAMVGSKVAEQWQFPQEIRQAIANHHTYEDILNEEKASLTGAIYLANQMSKAALVGCGGDFIARDLPDSVWAHYGYLEMSKQALVDMFYDELTEYTDFLCLKDCDVEMALERNIDSGTAVIIDSEDTHNWLLSFFLVNQGFTVETISDPLSINGMDEVPKLCVLRPVDIGAAMVAVEKIESLEGGPTPTVCILPEGVSQKDAIGSHDWLRAIVTPTDYFLVLCGIRELLPELLESSTTLENALAEMRSI